MTQRRYAALAALFAVSTASAGPLPASLGPTNVRLPSADWASCAAPEPSKGLPPKPPTARDATPPDGAGQELGEDWTYPLEKRWPLRSGYGWRVRNGIKEFHPGIDLAVSEWTPVFGSRQGVVEFAGDGGDFGNLVVLRHSDGARSYYGHLNKVLVKKGQKLTRRIALGLSGDTGRSTGAHLHFEIRGKNGRTLDPVPLLGLAVASK